MASTAGPFTLTKFFGASVLSYSSSIGWGEQSSTVSIGLVEDVQNGDRWRPQPVGTPCKFTFEGFTFEGLLQRHLQKADFQGNPTYEVTLVSPTEILAGAQVILDSFYQPVGLMPNLLNVFGYWENTLGYGGSMVNESGMLWQAPFSVLDVAISGSVSSSGGGSVGVKPAIEWLTSGQGGVNYGGPLQFRGHYYSVDLGGLPLTPTYYRIGGETARSILDMVSEICQDGGYDYIVVLEGSTIKFRTVSRLNQPSIGTIANYVNSRQDVTDKSVGIELRNDVTNAVLLGGDFISLSLITNPNMDQTIWPYWGLDANGQVIVGQGNPEQWHEFYLNASPIADIMGGTQYHCTIPELRLAATGDFDSWAAWVMRQYPDKAQTINLVGAIDSTSVLAEIFPDGVFQKDNIAGDPLTIKFMGGMNESDYWTKRANRVFEFVQLYATEYFGRRFLVKLPFQILWKVEPETTHVVRSDEPTDAGYQPEGSQPLGLSYANEDVFMADDGRIECFCLFPPDYTKIDLQKMDPNNYVAQQNGLYIRAAVDMSIGIVYLPNSLLPYCVVELSEAVTLLPPDPWGGIQDIATVLGLKDPALLVASAYRHGDFPLRIAPAPYRPIAAAVPMKSNRMSYGPWGTFSPWGRAGLPGKVHFERDPSLTPWEYGDFTTMNAAAAAKLANVATNMQESETGHVQVAGFPDISLADSLVAGGPTVTGISVSAGTGGVTTTYEMRTFTRVFGAFARENADRLRRIGIAAQQIRRSVRALYHKQQTANYISYQAQVGFMQNTSRAVQQRTPHDVLYGRMTQSDKYGYRTQCSTSTYPEAIANCRGDQSDKWGMTGAMSLEGLLRPFSTEAVAWNQASSSQSSKDVPHLIKPDYVSSIWSKRDKMPTMSSLNAFGDYNDVDIVAWGDTYPGEMHTLKAAALDGQEVPGGTVTKPVYNTTPDTNPSSGPPLGVRPLGIRFPMMAVGYGFEYTGKPFPNRNEKDSSGNPARMYQWSDTFADKYRQHPENWRCGPVALHYDIWRGVWTIPTFLKGNLQQDLPTDGSASSPMMIVAFGSSIQDKVDVWCDLGGPTLTGGSLVYASYYQLTNTWFVTAASCSG